MMSHVDRRRCWAHGDLIVWMVAAVAMPGCHTETPEPQTSAPAVKGDDVLAVVGGEPIHTTELKASAREALGVVGDTMLAGGHEDRLLEGLVTRKAMAQVHWGEMDSKAKARMERKVHAYRERLLAKAYIEAHTADLKPSDDAVLSYYEQHADRFGAREFKMFELLGTDLGQRGPDRAVRLKRMSALSRTADEDWKRAALKPEVRGWLTWKKGDIELGTLHPKLRQTITQLKPSEVSAIVMIGEKAYVVRVTGIKTQVARPLSEVRGEIEEILRPRMYRDAIENLKHDVLKQVHVEYTTMAAP